MGPECLSTLQARFAAHSGGKTRRLYLAFYDLLAQGHLTVGSRLPASRQLAPTLGVGRNTVTATYQQLIDEGLLYTAQRGGTRVRAPAGGGIDRVNHRTSSSPAGQVPGISRRGHARAIQPRPISLCPGEPDSTLFPRVAWSRALAAAARSDKMQLGYRYDMGEQHLREAIARYLARWRSLVVDPDRILITASTRQSLALAGSLYADAGDLAWVESPGYSGASDAWRLLGLQLRPMSVDAQGLVCPDDFCAGKLLYTTPCFQYPYGHGLAPARRLELLERAGEAGTVIFEDDYDSEFRDDSQPRPALASAAADLNATVLHAGTFSKLMFPAVRLAWLVLPIAHVSAAKGVLRSLGGGHNAAQQRAVAELLDNGTVAKHLVRARSEYGRRRRAVIDCLASGPLQVRPGSGGLSLVIDLPEPVARAPLVKALRENGVGAQPLEQLSLTEVDTPDCRALVVGTGNVDVAATASAVERLLAAWRQVC